MLLLGLKPTLKLSIYTTNQPSYRWSPTTDPTNRHRRPIPGEAESNLLEAIEEYLHARHT